MVMQATGRADNVIADGSSVQSSVGREIERRSILTSAALNENFLSGPQSRPVVLTGLTESWPAMQRWTLDFFSERYGSDRVLVTEHLGSPNLHKVRLDRYLDYVRDPSAPFLSKDTDTYPWYAPYWTPFIDHPELLADFDVTPAVENWLPAPRSVDPAAADIYQIMGEWALRGFIWLFVGPKGTISPRHIDTLNTHAWNTQISGRKRFDLWAPDRPEDDPQPDMSVELAAGETIVIPARWAHSVVALAPSISLTGNFFNRTNCADFLSTVYTMPKVWRSKGRMVPAMAAWISE